ncbi:membrane dipeptidase, partial [Parvibaculum sp.]
MKRVIAGVAIAILLLVALGFVLLPGILESNINRVAEHEPYEVSEAAQALHDRLMVVDLHADTLLWARDPLERGSRGHVDVPRLAEGNVTLQVFSAVTKVPYDQQYTGTSGNSDIITLLSVVQRWPARTRGSLLERALFQAERLKDAEARAPEKLMIVRSATDLERLIERRNGGSYPVGGLLAIEGAHPLEGKLENIERLRDAGYRMMG